MKTINDNQNKEVIIICELSVNDDRTIDTRNGVIVMPNLYLRQRRTLSLGDF